MYDINNIEFGKRLKELRKEKGMTLEEVAKAIVDQFPDTSVKDIAKVVKRYRDIDAWPKTTEFSEDSFNHLQDIMIDYGAIDEKVPYAKLMYRG